jgi:hypothetical protein
VRRVVFAGILGTTLVVTGSTVQSAPRPPVNGKTTKTNQSTVEHRSTQRSPAAQATVNQSDFICRYWTVKGAVLPTTVGSSPTDTAAPVVKVPSRHMVQCTNKITGKKGRERDLGETGTDRTDEWVVKVPDPVQLVSETPVDGRFQFVSQRPGYIWYPAFYNDFNPAVVVKGTGAPTDATAHAVMKSAEFWPGFGPIDKVLNCAGAVPYDRGLPHLGQPDSCWFVYAQAGTYDATMRVIWDVTVTWPDGFSDTLTLQSDGVIPITVRQIQTVVVCESGDANGCPLP